MGACQCKTQSASLRRLPPSGLQARVDLNQEDIK